MTTTANLFTLYPTHPGVKASGPSAEAAMAMKPTAATMRRDCTESLSYANLTADQIAAHLGLSVLSIRLRVSELLAMGLIEDSGQRRKNQSGKSATVWMLK